MKQTFTIAESQLTRESSKTSLGPDKKVSYVMRLFSKGPREYDFLLRILSLGRDRYWRNSIIDKAQPKAGSTVLDIACGTGLVTYSFARLGSYAVGIDVTREMLREAKQMPESGVSDVDFILARAENLPLRSDIFDASTISLALRNVSSQIETLSEMRRCTKQGKPIVSLDFARPKGRLFSRFYSVYIFRILPALGLLISRHWNMIFLYLANSIEKSRDPEKVRETMNSIGLNGSSIKRMTKGTTALVSGFK
jgi:demethylmenaquinone methyltransferase / 2-methoxy-6-polyprenyl-1,4-benzoquinol methylase